MKGGKYSETLAKIQRNNLIHTRYLKKCFTQIYRDLYGDAMTVPIRMGTNIADGSQQKDLVLPSFASKA